MEKITFSKDQLAQLVRKFQLYFQEELEHDIGQFEAEFLLDFIGEEIGVHYYNQGLLDAQAVLEAKVDTIQDAISELERVPSGS